MAQKALSTITSWENTKRADFLPALVGGVNGKVAWGIWITRSSIKPNISSCLFLSEFGRSLALYPDQATSIRVLQLGSNIAVFPSGIWLTTERSYVYKSSPAADSYIPFQIDTSTEGGNDQGCLRVGVYSVDRDKTLHVLSAGYMCAKGWKGKHDLILREFFSIVSIEKKDAPTRA
ncbi:lecithin:cholesterol/phospholipid:diacylglycerol acyltransferase [Artemisia annua]|uniref:Lecithin:cholesterol/phospholipid:diacylglycerol acyltransferase n=1 Tax=Artemisia annua TaxID=35608 RepID=A0A2U1KA37_ARTAN|nr:lecithin:cholesterol/phospholipid:diacylglycerol acyltransferase [Artemisia annua]